MRTSTRSRVWSALLRFGLIGLIGAAVVYPTSALQTQPAGPVGSITGQVQSTAGPEVGVWVIAETKDFQTPFIKIVVTGDQGRFVVPDLPNANYNVWVRGYGLADSTPVQLKPSTTAASLRATVAPNEQVAAKVYPGNYWLTMLDSPPKSAFPLGTVATQENWMWGFKSSCNFCHQLGNAETRDLDHVFKAVPTLKTDEEAWDYRLRGGVRGTNMFGSLQQLDRVSGLKMFVDWTKKIKAGETPAVKPTRPAGVERNVVLTLWDWGTDHSFMHDENSTSKQNPRVNANGPVYAVSAGHGTLVLMDPATNSTREIEIPTRDPRASVPSRFPAPNPPSIHWGAEHLWANPPYNPADPHNPMMDSKGRVWMTSKIHAQQPAWCRDAAGGNKFAAYKPLTNSGRQASYYDPKTQKFQLIETCFSTHHLQFDNDPNETVYFNELSGPIFGWLDSKIYDSTLAETKDEVKAEKAAVGWCPQVLDTNGDGKITKPWNSLRAGVDNVLNTSDTQGEAAPAARGGRGGRGAAQAAYDPKLDTEISGTSLYSVIPSPVDDSVWGVAESFPGFLVRLQRGNNAPDTCKTTIFKVPLPGLDPRGVDVGTDGVVWTALAASSHLASFDVRKCKDLNGAAKTDGSQCKEGWTLYQTDGPKFKNIDTPTDFHYFNWVDQADVLGFGKNTPMANGSNSDAILVLDPATRKWVTMRVPYALGFYSRGMDARIDDPNTGWKGRGLWANYGTHFVWHIEGGKGTKGKIVKFQVRPNPLAN